MAVVQLTNKNLNDYARQFSMLLQEYGGSPIAKKTVCEKLGLTTGQVSTLVKYMRRCSEEDLERYIYYYPISSKQGYKLPRNTREFLPCFTTLYLWSKSLERTIEPMKRKMLRDGIDIDAYIKEVKRDIPDNYLEDLVEMNADTSWFLD